MTVVTIERSRDSRSLLRNREIVNNSDKEKENVNLFRNNYKLFASITNQSAMKSTKFSNLTKPDYGAVKIICSTIATITD